MKKKWFTVKQLNDRIKNIALSHRDTASRPATLMNDSSCKVRGQAVEIYYLIRLLPILIHDKVLDCEDGMSNLYLTLKSITIIVMSPKLHITQAEYLRVVIGEYVAERVRIFAAVPLRPKHHFLCHYPDLCYRYGPLGHCSTLRFESKHSYFKRIIRTSQNFKNITLTMSSKHEMLEAYCRAGNLIPDDLTQEKCFEFHSGIIDASVVHALHSVFSTPVSHTEPSVNLQGHNL